METTSREVPKEKHRLAVAAEGKKALAEPEWTSGRLEGTFRRQAAQKRAHNKAHVSAYQTLLALWTRVWKRLGESGPDHLLTVLLLATTSPQRCSPDTFFRGRGACLLV